MARLLTATFSSSNRSTIVGTEYPKECNEIILRLASIDKRGITLNQYLFMPTTLET